LSSLVVAGEKLFSLFGVKEESLFLMMEWKATGLEVFAAFYSFCDNIHRPYRLFNQNDLLNESQKVGREKGLPSL